MFAQLKTWHLNGMKEKNIAWRLQYIFETLRWNLVGSEYKDEFNFTICHAMHSKRSSSD
jgi:hypothetical protein